MDTQAENAIRAAFKGDGPFNAHTIPTRAFAILSDLDNGQDRISAAILAMVAREELVAPMERAMPGKDWSLK